MARLFVNETIIYGAVGDASGDGDPLDLPNARITLLRADLLWANTGLTKSGYGTGLIKVLVENESGTFVENTAYRKRFQRSFNSPAVPAGTPCFLGGAAYQVSSPDGLFKDIESMRTRLGVQRRVRIILSLFESRSYNGGAPIDDATMWAGTVVVACE